MRNLLLITSLISLSLTCAYAQSVPVGTPVSAAPAKIILFISEQNIDTPRSAWWASEVDLSATEAEIARNLLNAGFEIIEPGALDEVIDREKAFRMVNLSDKSSVKMASLAHADYVILGKAVASAGGRVPHSNMRSCFANLTAKVITVKTGKVIAYLDASGSAAHMDVISGGREALVSAGSRISGTIIEKLNAAIRAGAQ